MRCRCRRSRAPLAATVMLVPLLLSCGNGDGALAVNDPWARPTPDSAGVAAFYAVVDNASSEDDVLVSASSSRCVTALVHASVVSDGVMSMAEATRDQRSVDAGGELDLEPGGLHVMCLGMAGPLVEGEEIDLTLGFERAGAVSVTVAVEQR